jgi:SAM-dependent MidA family methyltransferase
MRQGEFLMELGVAARAERLADRADAATRGALRLALHRLTAPNEMGTLFKVMAITRSDIAPPPFAGRI